MAHKAADNTGRHEQSYQEYMDRIKKETIPCYEPSLGEEELELLTDVIKRGWLSENKYTRQFESQLSLICQRRYALAFANATSALITGMKSLGIREGDEVIVPSFTHPADPNAISATGATPVFADVDERTLCLSVETIEEVKTERTKAILFVALYGNAEGLDEVEAYAQKNNLFLINDCAAALFGTYKQKPIPAYGDFSALSFFADKTITTGEGGLLLTDNSDLLAECNIYKHDGRRERGVDLIERRGFNFRITELQTAIGVAQLKKAPSFVQRKKEILAVYRAQLAGIPNVRFFSFTPHGDIVPHRILLFVPDAQALIGHLTMAGIGVRTTFMPLHRMPCYDVQKDFPVTEKLYKTGVCLPSAPTLTPEQLEFICSTIKNFYREASHENPRS